MPTLPYILGVQLNTSSGSGRTNATIKVTNQRTGDILTSTTNDQGEAVFDLANFTQGYLKGDALTVEKVVSNSNMEYYVSANGNETNPTWVEVNDETETTISPNTARFKLNSTNYPGGRQIDITLD